MSDGFFSYSVGNAMASGSISVPYTISNTGTAPLTGISITKSGVNANVFTITSSPAISVNAGGSTTFTLQFSPPSTGTFNVSLHIASNDADESPFDLNLTGYGIIPTTTLEQPAGTLLSQFRNVNFGTELPGQPKNLTFTLKNTDSMTLTDLQVIISGTNASNFTIVHPPSATLAPGMSTTLEVQFIPSFGSTHFADMRIAPGNPDIRIFEIGLSGIGLAPEIHVESLGEAFEGLPSPRLIDGGSMSFDLTQMGTSKIVFFSIQNYGTLDLTNLHVTVDGAHASEYLILIQPEPSLEAGQVGSAYFGVQFTPSTTGLRTATLHITSNDADENPFDIHLSSESISPEIKVEDENGVELENRGVLNHGDVELGKSKRREVKITNTGIGPLKIDQISISPVGTSADLILTPRTTKVSLNAGESHVMNLDFTPSRAGLHEATISFRTNDQHNKNYAFDIRALGALANISVEQPSGTTLTPGSSRSLGTAGGERIITFALKNTGTAPMTSQSFLTGTHAADFSVTTHPQSPLSPGASTTMTVSFIPRAEGPRQAILRIAHNGQYPDPPGFFDIPLTGTGAFSRVYFTSDVFTARHEDTQGLVTLRRQPATDPVTLKIMAVESTAQSMPPLEKALLGVDFLSPTAPAALISFAANEAEKTVAIQLLSPSEKAEKSRRFKVVLHSPSPRVYIGQTGPSEAMLNILARDTTKPTLTLTNPAAGKVGAPLPLIVSGKAGDAKGIDRVEVKLDAAEPVLATLSTSATKPTEVPFTCELSPSDGIHTLVVTAYDLRGNSTSVTRSIAFTRRRMLTVKLVDGGPEPVGLPGALAMTAKPAASAAALKADPANALIKTTTVVPGTQVKLVTTPKAGYVFHNWLVLNSHGNVPHMGPELTFTMPDADLTVEATTAPTAFVTLPGHNSSLHWILVPAETTETRPLSSQLGYLSGTITLKGGFTGKLLMNGQTQPVKATFYGDGPAFFTVAGQKRDSLPVPGGNLKLYYDYLPATLTSPTGELLAMADLQHGLAKAPASLLNSATKGTYTVRLNPAPEPLDPATSPQASGYATMTLSNTGVISLAGALADGTAVTQTSALLPDNKAPVFIQLPTPGGTTKLGLLIGQLDFDIVPATTDVTSALQWFRPAAASTKVLLYPAGWPGGIGLDAQGALYSATKTTQSAFFDLTSNTPSPARLNFTGGKLASPIQKTNFGLKGNSVVKTTPADASYTLTITPATGLFSGTFTPNWSNPNSAKPTFKGVILQKGPASAQGFFINNAKGETAPESGSVTLGPPAE